MQYQDIRLGHYLLTEGSDTFIIFIGFDRDSWLFHILGREGVYLINPDDTIWERRLADNGYTYQLHLTSWSCADIHVLPLEITLENVHVSLPTHSAKGSVTINGLSVSPKEALSLLAILESQEDRLRALVDGRDLSDVNIYYHPEDIR